MTSDFRQNERQTRNAGQGGIRDRDHNSFFDMGLVRSSGNAGAAMQGHSAGVSRSSVGGIYDSSRIEQNPGSKCCN